MFQAPVNAVKAVARVAKATVARKAILVSEAGFSERQSICRSRASQCFDSSLGRCKLCSCIVSLKAKLATEFCPRGLWPVISLTGNPPIST